MIMCKDHIALAQFLKQYGFPPALRRRAKALDDHSTNVSGFEMIIFNLRARKLCSRKIMADARGTVG